MREQGCAHFSANAEHRRGQGTEAAFTSVASAGGVARTGLCEEERANAAALITNEILVARRDAIRMRRATRLIEFRQVHAEAALAAEMVARTVPALSRCVAGAGAACAVCTRRRTLKCALHFDADKLTRGAAKLGLAGLSNAEVTRDAGACCKVAANA